MYIEAHSLYHYQSIIGISLSLYHSDPLCFESYGFKKLNDSKYIIDISYFKVLFNVIIK